MESTQTNLTKSKVTDIPGLFQQALNGDPDAWEDEAYAHATFNLGKCIDESFPQAREWILAGDSRKRRVGIDVLKEYVVQRECDLTDCRPTRSECHELLVSMLKEGDKLDRALIPPIIRVLSDLKEPGWIDLVSTFAPDSDPEIRCSVAIAFRLGSDERQLDVLVSLSRDPKRIVRDGAVSMMASQMRVIPKKACDALADRLCDPAEAIKLQAICGLVKARDARAVEPMRERIKTYALTGLIRSAVEDLCNGEGFDEQWNPVFRELAIPAFNRRAVFSDDECLNDVDLSEFGEPDIRDVLPTGNTDEVQKQSKLLAAELNRRIDEITKDNPAFVAGQTKRLIAIGRVQLYPRPLGEWLRLVSYLEDAPLPPVEAIPYEEFPAILASMIPEDRLSKEIADEEPWEAFLLLVMVEAYCKERSDNLHPRLGLYFPLLSEDD